MGRIVQIQAKQILDSRGIPTIEADVYTDRGIVGRASVPSAPAPGNMKHSNYATTTKADTSGKV